MRENRTCGSEGGEAQSLPYPYPVPAQNSVCICGLNLCQGWDFPAFAGLEEFELEVGLDGAEGLA